MKFTNIKQKQVKADNPNYYYCKGFEDVTIEEMKAFIGLRLQMENFRVGKPRYESYWHGRSKNFITRTDGFGEVMTRDRFLALWSFLHLLDETDPSIDKQDRIYQVRPMMNLLLPKFRHYYRPSQYLSLDEGMIPATNRLGIKQYVKSKPIKWGIKSFLLCEGNSGYIINASIYTGKNDDFNQEIGIVGTVVSDLVTSADIQGLNHVLVMDRFYTSVILYDFLHRVLGTLAVGTCMTNRKFFPKVLKNKKKMKQGEFSYMCNDNIVCMT